MIKFDKLDWPIDKVWITSDTHWSHKNICSGISQWPDINKCRKFDTLDEMNAAIINGINDNVKEDDLLIHNGDVSFGGKDNIPIFQSLIKCKNIIYIEGNHDHHLKHYVQNLTKKLYLQIDEYEFVLSHFPEFHWHNMEKGSFMLHGHLHDDRDGIIKQMHDNYRIMDIGIDVAFRLYGEYRPFRLTEVIGLLENKYIKDRHV